MKDPRLFTLGEIYTLHKIGHLRGLEESLKTIVKELQRFDSEVRAYVIKNETATRSNYMRNESKRKTNRADRALLDSCVIVDN